MQEISRFTLYTNKVLSWNELHVCFVTCVSVCVFCCCIGVLVWYTYVFVYLVFRVLINTLNDFRWCHTEFQNSWLVWMHGDSLYSTRMISVNNKSDQNDHKMIVLITHSQLSSVLIIGGNSIALTQNQQLECRIRPASTGASIRRVRLFGRVSIQDRLQLFPYPLADNRCCR